jgi:hypothetical protein
LNGLLDLITISFVSRFGKRPMHLFGAIGVLMFIIGLSFTTYLGVDKLFFNTKARLITERAEFYLALSAMLLGTQLFLAGFLGELVVRSQTDKDRYYISEKINLNIQQ